MITRRLYDGLHTDDIEIFTMGSNVPGGAAPPGFPPIEQLSAEQIVSVLTQALQNANQALANPKHAKIDVQPFDGTDYALYPQFESTLRAKFELEASTFRSESAKVWWALGRLKDKAARVMNPWTEAYKNAPTEFTVEALFGQMKIQFGDAERQRKALDQIRHLRQGNRTFEDLLADFNRLLLEAGGYKWDDGLKKGMLQDALSLNMKKHMISITEANTFGEYCVQVKSIADRYEAVQRIEKASRSRYGSSTANRTPAQHSFQTANRDTSDPLTEPMDWEPTHSRTDAGERRRAKWVDDTQYERRKKEHLCLRCGASGHIIRNCPYLPARRPTTNRNPPAKHPRVASVAPMLEDTPSKDDTDTESDSGKE